jgi:hypothetical protein
MTWKVGFHSSFEREFDELDQDVQDEILALMGLLQEFGPRLARPRVGTLNGSRHANLKELRFQAADGVWRLPSIPSAKRSCWSPEISRAAANGGSTRT